MQQQQQQPAASQPAASHDTLDRPRQDPGHPTTPVLSDKRLAAQQTSDVPAASRTPTGPLSQAVMNVSPHTPEYVHVPDTAPPPPPRKGSRPHPIKLSPNAPVRRLDFDTHPMLHGHSDDAGSQS
ncbi:hypothetical protein WJX72_006376 [[Myrmecia] bisecta]|uniref:Uncharacterized protein n=1 Tax=[Myrmecia] bisecta TaxID=41462 RepID=A0AAW1PS04_9CHLO